MHHFFAYMARMRNIKRWGLMHNTSNENDLEHSAQVAMVAHALAVIGNTRYQKAYDMRLITVMALYHDACEVITGDMPTPIKQFNQEIKLAIEKMEEMAQKKLVEMLPPDLRDSYRCILVPDESTLEWKLVKLADRLCAYSKCVEEVKAGNGDFLKAHAAIHADLQKVKLPEFADFLAEFMPSFSLSLDELN